MMIVTYSEARRRGLRRYFTAKPCKHGHIAERITDNGTCVECHYVRVAKQEQKHPRDRRRYRANYYQKNKAKFKKKTMLYFKTEIGRAINVANAANTKAKKLKIKGRITGLDVLAIFSKYKSCFYCSEPLNNNNRTIDHKRPFTRGGTNYIKNIVGSCDHCNKCKKDKLPSEFHGVPAISPPTASPE